MESKSGMEDLQKIRSMIFVFFCDVVARTHPPAVNNYWSVTLMWGCVLTFGYILVCTWLGLEAQVRGDSPG